MGTFDDLGAQLDPDDERRRGKQFEYVCQWFLTNDPTYKTLLRKVWLWNEWPGRWGSDAGIDLVAEDTGGRLWAIQAKAYNLARSVTKEDVNKFLAESSRLQFSYRMLIATTDKLHHIAQRTMEDLGVSFIGLTELQAADDYLDWPRTPADLLPSKPPMPKRPWDYQRTAMNDVVKGFKEADRGQLIMACGTGKTLTAWFITQKLAAERTLVLVPSLSLLKQTMREWRTANVNKPFDALPVCSDETVGHDEDAAISHASYLAEPADTDPEVIAAFLRKRSGPRVVFSTYQSSPQIAKAFNLGRVPAFDLVIADEAHRVAGDMSSDFATILDSSAINAKRRLFMTATPRYYTGRIIRQAKEAEDEVASMDDHTKFGEVFHRLGFSEAIERKLLTDYQVAIIGVDNDTYRDWAERGKLIKLDGKKTDARSLAGQIGLAKAMREYDLRRVISFHGRVRTAHAFAGSMQEVIDWMPPGQRPEGPLWSKHVSGKMTAGQRHNLLQRLKRLDEGERGLLTNARCLSEGVDVPTLDGVAFIDPRRSEVDIVQSVGRAIRLADDKALGTIVIPVFIDTAQDPEVALDESVFKPVWDVIKALRSHDDELGRQLDELRRELGRHRGRLKLPTKIRHDLSPSVSVDFARAFDVRLVERTTASWELMFGALERFVDNHEHSRVPVGYVSDGLRLAGWVTRQRVAYGEQTLEADRRHRLEALPGWTWDPFADKWEAGFNTLLSYVERHGPVSVPQPRVVDGFALGNWVTQQRIKRTKGTLDEDRESRLEAVPGWSWNPKADQWSNGFERLLDYVSRGGDARIPARKAVDGFPLGRWVDVQRREYAKGSLRPDRQRQLEAIPGWTWRAHQDRWEQRFAQLQTYVEQHGDASVPDDYTVGGTALGNWVGVQRKLHATGKLSADRTKRLSGLPGWNWNAVTTLWEAGFTRLEAYVKTHGDARVSYDYTTDGYALGRWVSLQRINYGKGTIEPERAARLEKLAGWTWQANQDRWDDGYTQLREYVARHGDARVKGNYVINGFDLGRWTNKQRTRHGKGLLEPERAARLEGLPGWSWDPHAEKWEDGFRHLEQYITQHGNAWVPAAYVADDGYPLGSWAVRQRRKHTLGGLGADRKQRLESLNGWSWAKHSS